MWSETLCSMSCSSTVHQTSYLDLTLCWTELTSEYLWAYWGTQMDQCHTYILSLLLEDKRKKNVSFTLFFFSFPPRKAWRKFFRGIFSSTRDFAEQWLIRHLSSPPHGAVKVQLVFWSPISNCSQKIPELACPLLHHCQPELPLTPQTTLCCDCTPGKHCTSFGLSITFSHVPLLCIFLLTRSLSSLFPFASPKCFMQPASCKLYDFLPFSLYTFLPSWQRVCEWSLCQNTTTNLFPLSFFPQ